MPDFNRLKNKKLIITVFAFLILVILFIAAYLKNSPTPIDLSTYENMLKENVIKKASIEDEVVVLYTDSGKYSIVKDGVDITSLLQKVPVEISSGERVGEEVVFFLLFISILIILILFGKSAKEKSEPQRQNEKNKMESFELESLMPLHIKPAVSKITFDDVAGIESVKEELYEIVDFLKNPSKYKKFGISLPKGVLLIGPPGVGKTMIAKAVAGEANVPFFYQSGASFVQIYVGMGAKRVKELFSYAKKFAPSIIFIDEIDAVGRARGGMRNDERESTLNQLLTEMDGFEESSGVIVIGATNKIEIIDEALLRAGRFDRRVFVPLPDLKDRIKILEIYLRNKPHNVDIEEIAKMTVGFSGAALSTLVNEAAINALRHNRDKIEMRDFQEVKDKVLLGKKKVLSFSEEEKKIQALYQAAKAISAYWFEIDFDKIGIVGDSIKEVEREIESKSQMISKIKVFLSGSVACKIFLNEVYSNAKEDIAKAKILAKVMIEQYAMGESLTANPAEIEKILQEAQKEVKKFLEGMKEPIFKISQIILKQESVSKSELKKVINEVF
ncbi:MAG: ATP-dependent metallopeptidase FtsH/Yme1/Tma family protein [Epsilonproteobacteria bacterium]|nr:ATP-dependent metallopeptidase FtsH/Yme1/Tma family protein [Campylobacterota bacterium]